MAPLSFASRIENQRKCQWASATYVLPLFLILLMLLTSTHTQSCRKQTMRSTMKCARHSTAAPPLVLTQFSQRLFRLFQIPARSMTSLRASLGVFTTFLSAHRLLPLPRCVSCGSGSVTLFFLLMRMRARKAGTVFSTHGMSSSSSTSNRHKNVVAAEEVQALQTHLFHKGDSVFAVNVLNAPTYNMRTWAASTRNAGGISSKAKQKMSKWDTSYVEEARDEGSFLNSGPSALIRRRRPSDIRSSRNTLPLIRHFKPGAEGNEAVRRMLDRDSEQFVRRTFTPNVDRVDGGIPPAHAAHLKQEVLRPLVELRGEEFAAESCLFSPTLKLEWKPRNSGTHRPVSMTVSSLLAPSVRAPPESLSSGAGAAVAAHSPSSSPSPTSTLVLIARHPPHGAAPAGGAPTVRPPSPTRTELPKHQNVDYGELHREQQIILEANAEQELGYAEAKEDLARHMLHVREAFDAMLRGSFYDVRAASAMKTGASVSVDQSSSSAPLLPPIAADGGVSPSPLASGVAQGSKSPLPHQKKMRVVEFEVVFQQRPQGDGDDDDGDGCLTR